MKLISVFLLTAGAFSLISGPAWCAQLPGQSAEQASYISPYRFNASVAYPALIADFLQEPRVLTNFPNWSLTPNQDWQNFPVIQHLHSTWGPYYRPFPAPSNAEHQTRDWCQKRLAAAASLLRNTTPYAHHHMGQWFVPDTAEWTSAGYAPGYGIDCSDFTHFVYSYALGISLKTGIGAQAALTSAPMTLADGSQIQVAAQRLYDVQHGYVKTYADLVSQLEPGDLLYIRGNAGLQTRITHVIMWLGPLAFDTKGKDSNLVMDSHGAKVTDSNGNLIPSGPEIRPFAENSYYFRAYDHVIRYLPLKRL